MFAPFPPVVFSIFGGGLHIQKPVFAAVQHIRTPCRGKMRHLISQISGDAKGRADAQEEGLEVSQSFTGEGGNVSIQAVAGGQNHSAKIPHGQVGEVMAYVSAINTQNTRGQPLGQPRV